MIKNTLRAGIPSILQRQLRPCTVYNDQVATPVQDTRPAAFRICCALLSALSTVLRTITRKYAVIMQQLFSCILYIWCIYSSMATTIGYA